MTATPATKATGWLSVTQLAEHLGIGADWVHRRVASREIPCHRIGNRARFSPADVAAIERMTAVPATPRARLTR